MKASLASRPHYVYRAYDADGVLLYVGCTAYYRTRLEQHASSSAWWLYSTDVTWRGYPTRSAARAGEAAAIRSEHPVFNIRGRAVPEVYAFAGRDAYLSERLLSEAVA